MVRARSQLVLLLLAGLAWPAARAHADEPSLPATDQRYELDATLDPRTHTIHGSERIRFRNHASQALHELYFHLYLNAFRDRGTVFMREGGAGLRAAQLHDAGGIELTQLQIEGESAPLARAESELVPGDRTQLRVSLRHALAPGATLQLELSFVAKLPALVARSGYAGDFHLVAQWFPKLARLEDDGRWASFPYHGLGEFYADFADYAVRITLPSGYQLGATGSAVASQRHDSLRTDEFHARAVHDFAFAAYPHFESRVRSVEGVRLIVLCPAGYAAAAERQARVVAAGLAAFGRRFGRYPYETLTVILPPRDAHAASGMEYPTFFVSAGPWWALPPQLPDPLHDFVAAHELAHQWFSGMIASNEVAFPMLDEGLAQWAALTLLDELYAASPARSAALRSSFDAFDVAALFYRPYGEHLPSSLLAANQYDYETLAQAVYLRPALVLEALARAHGRARVETALGWYAREQRFRHPTPQALFTAFDEVYGAGFSARELEPALAGARDARLPPPAGAGPNAPAPRSFFAEALLLAQTFLRGVGP